MKDVIKQLKKMIEKLDILIALQMVEEKPKTSREKIRLLGELGASPIEIASILRVKPKYVSKERSLMKKKNAKKK